MIYCINVIRSGFIVGVIAFFVWRSLATRLHMDFGENLLM